MVRAKGKAAAKVAKVQPPDVETEKPALLPTEVITVPVEEEEDSPPLSEVTTRTSKKRKPNTNSEKKADKENGIDKKANTEKGSDEKPYVRGKAALNAYWDELASITPDGPPVATLKQVVQHLRKTAVVQLKKKGAFKVHGLCEMRVRHIKGRAPKKSNCFGKDIEMKAKPPRQRVYAKCPKDLSDSVVKETNV